MLKYIWRIEMKKCPYCFESLPESQPQCPHCSQFIIDPIVEVDYKSFEKKGCVFCGKKVLKEAKICKFCHRWLNEVNWAADDYEKID